MSSYSLVRPLLFRLDAERAHELAFALLAQLERVTAGPSQPQPYSDPILRQTLWGLEFANPVGLAAGLDKNARVPHVWPRFHFGFAELGTITALAQSGNPKPRLFRLAQDEALINRMGFNNDGASAIAPRLTAILQNRPRLPLGINLGKSRAAALEDAVDDYLASFRVLFDVGDYFVINVSSPNTPGLRDLQQETQLSELAAAVAAENVRLAAEKGRAPRPLLIKLSPDLSEEGLLAVANVARAQRMSGLIATNTTLSRDGLTTRIEESGGLSGRPLRQRSTAAIRTLYRQLGGELPIIGVGGIFDADDAYEKILAGASLVQIYTGFIYHGPGLPRRIAGGIAERLRHDGFAHIGEAIGRDV